MRQFFLLNIDPYAISIFLEFANIQKLEAILDEIISDFKKYAEFIEAQKSSILKTFMNHFFENFEYRYNAIYLGLNKEIERYYISKEKELINKIYNII